MLTALNKIEEAITMVFLAAIVIFVFVAALLRTIGYPVIWSVDIAQLLFIWVCMLGANQTLRRNEHVGVDFLVRRLAPKNRLKINLALYVLIGAFLVLLIIYGIELTRLNPERLLGTTQLPYALVTAAIPVGAGLMLLTVIHNISVFVKALKQENSDHA